MLRPQGQSPANTSLPLPLHPSTTTFAASMKPSILSIPLFLLSAADYASAVHFIIRGRPRTRRLSSDILGRRANVTGTSSVSDVSDVQYDTDITLGGQSFTVQIDTGRRVALGTAPCSRQVATLRYLASDLVRPVLGHTSKAHLRAYSSDLWVSGSVSNAKSTGKSTQVTYAVGEVEGTHASMTYLPRPGSSLTIHTLPRFRKDRRAGICRVHRVRPGIQYAFHTLHVLRHSASDG